jgi:phage gpG-like protein
LNVYYKPKALNTLNNKLAFVKGPGSRKLAVDLAAAVELGNEHDRLRGLDKFGHTQTAVKKRKGIYRGKTGPPLAPSGVLSRSISLFKAVVKGSRPPYTILAGWAGVVSSKGFPFLPVLNTGNRKRTIPARPFFGISPNTWALIRSRIKEFQRDFQKVK